MCLLLAAIGGRLCGAVDSTSALRCEVPEPCHRIGEGCPMKCQPTVMLRFFVQSGRRWRYGARVQLRAALMKTAARFNRICLVAARQECDVNLGNDTINVFADSPRSQKDQPQGSQDLPLCLTQEIPRIPHRSPKPALAVRKDWPTYPIQRRFGGAGDNLCGGRRGRFNAKSLY
jgi:hypothetical protein